MFTLYLHSLDRFSCCHKGSSSIFMFLISFKLINLSFFIFLWVNIKLSFYITLSPIKSSLSNWRGVKIIYNLLYIKRIMHALWSTEIFVHLFVYFARVNFCPSTLHLGISCDWTFSLTWGRIPDEGNYLYSGIYVCAENMGWVFLTQIISMGVAL